MNEQQRRAAMLEEFEKLQKANVEGYAGCTASGTLVDRREIPFAYPVAANSMFNVTEPRCIQCHEVSSVTDLKNSICSKCRR